MQIIFAAPFILAAGLAFTILSLIPRARRWAIPIPTGILTSGPCFLATYLIQALLLNGLHFQPSDTVAESMIVVISCIAAVGGVLGGIMAATGASIVATLLPTTLLRLAVVLAGWCSYFVILLLLIFCVEQQFRLYDWLPWGWPFALALGLELLLSFIGAFLVAQNAEQFRSKRIHLPYGLPFRKRGWQGITPLAPDAPKSGAGTALRTSASGRGCGRGSSRLRG